MQMSSTHLTGGKTQLQIVDIEILRQIMAMRKNISVETGKVCVGV